MLLDIGPKELTGAVDLISHYKLLPHHEFFCKRSLPVSISDTHYLHNVVGDTEIRKGDGMQLDQLIQSTSYFSKPRIQPFDLDILREAFHLRETAPIDLPLVRILLVVIPIAVPFYSFRVSYLYWTTVVWSFFFSNKYGPAKLFSFPGSHCIWYVLSSIGR